MTGGIRRTGIYGGTFAPPHNGHIVAAAAFFEQMKLDELLIIPASLPPHKSVDPADDPAHRLTMCRLAFGEIKGVSVSDIEVSRGGTSYTVDTLRQLDSPGRKLFLLCGTDMMLSFDQWRDFETIFSLCCPVYIRRERDASLDERIIEKNKFYHKNYGVAFRRVIAEPVVISSSDIRKIIGQGGDVSEYLPRCVEKYIRENKLYVR